MNRAKGLPRTLLKLGLKDAVEAEGGQAGRQTVTSGKGKEESMNIAKLNPNIYSKKSYDTGSFT